MSCVDFRLPKKMLKPHKSIGKMPVLRACVRRAHVRKMDGIKWSGPCWLIEKRAPAKGLLLAVRVGASLV